MQWSDHLSSALFGDEQLLETLQVVDNAWLFSEMYIWEGAHDDVIRHYYPVNSTKLSLDQNDSTVTMITSLILHNNNLHKASLVLIWLMAHPTPQPRDQIKTWKIYFTKCFTSHYVDPADTRGDDDEPYDEWNKRIRKKYPSHWSQFKDRLDQPHQGSVQWCRICALCQAC